MKGPMSPKCPAPPAHAPPNHNGKMTQLRSSGLDSGGNQAFVPVF